MIEIICKDNLQAEEKEGKICLPKNIRQIGSPRGRHKIYIEDYVYTYLKTIAQKKEACAAVFLGKSWVVRDIRYTFISGAVECGAAVFQWDNIRLDDSFWEYIYKEEKKYFPEKQIVGWFLGKTGQIMELSPVVEAAHRKYFAGRDKVLMLMDVLESEEVFFIYDQGYLQKREGYYIYYERNNAMQEYMVSKREEEQRMDKLVAQAQAEVKEQEESENYSELQKKRGYKEAEELRKELEDDREPQRNNEQREIETQEEYKEGKKKQVQKESIDLEKYSEGKKKQVQKETRLEKKQSNIETEKFKDNQKQVEQEEIYKTNNKIETEEIKNTQKRIEQKEIYKAKGKTEAEEFRELHKELESIPDEKPEIRKREKIFAKSHLEEPKTQAEEALESYRNMILERQGKQIEKQNRNFLYTASAFFLVVICVIGITTINNYWKMQEVEEVLHIIKNTEVDKKEKEDLQRESELRVESVASQVEPLKEENQKEEQESNKSEQEKGEKETNQPKENQKEQQDKPETEEQEIDKEQETKEENTKEEENPVQTQETSNGQSAEVRYYTVQEGDTLASICINIYNNSEMMKKVCEANSIENGDKIYVGQKLLLP